jgi:hypothetical protein
VKTLFLFPLSKLVHWLRQRRPVAERLLLAVRAVPFTFRGYSPMLVTLPIDRVVTLFFTPEDKAHNPAPVDGVPFWSLSEPNLIEVFPAEDGLSAEARPVGKLGTAQVVVTADARLGPDIKNITGIYQLHIVGGEAVSLNLGVGELRPFPEVVPVEAVEAEVGEPAA